MMVLTCQFCLGVLGRDIEFEVPPGVEFRFKMAMKCPHCKKPSKVEIFHKVKVEMEVRLNSVMLRPGSGEAKDSIRTL